MKNYLSRVVATACIIASIVTSAGAATPVDHSNLFDAKSSIIPYASAYLSDYSISIGTRGNCRIVITMDVNAVRTVDKLGCLMLVIDQKIDGVWSTYDVLFGIENPDFYMYNTASYLGGYSFYGTAGVQYRATMTAYAQDSTGYDTGEELTSHVVTCSE